MGGVSGSSDGFGGDVELGVIGITYDVNKEDKLLFTLVT